MTKKKNIQLNNVDKATIKNKLITEAKVDKMRHIVENN